MIARIQPADPAGTLPQGGGFDGSANAILSVQDLEVHFPLSRSLGALGRERSIVHAVDGVSFGLRQGQTLALVGESGSGKTTIGRAVLGLAKASSGKVVFRGRDLTDLSRTSLRKMRRFMQLIPQDPYSSLNPRMTIASIVSEPLDVHHVSSKSERRVRVRELIETVGLPPRLVDRRPAELSGGQRQRVAVARALALEPSLIVCDEPTSSLDVSIRSQILDLLRNLQESRGVAYLFITHDLGTVSSIAQTVAVVYSGKLMELSPKEKLFRRPLHPYTRALISAIPIPDPVLERKRERIRIPGDPPSPIAPPSGCRFHTRCPFAQEICKEQEPFLENIGEGRLVACHFWREIEDQLKGGVDSRPDVGLER